MNINNFVNKNANLLYTKIKKRFYIIFFIVLVALVIWTFIKNIFGLKTESENSKTETHSLYKPAETVISGQDITESAYIEDENVINQFVDYCNNGDIENAYKLLSNDCKTLLFYDDIQKFKELYYNEIFETKRECNLQSWITNSDYHTYKIRLIDDIMTTGDYSKSSNYQDYITVIQDEENKTLNVKGLISKKDINKTKEEEEINIEVVSQIQYVDYLEFEFNVKNKTDKRILMDTLQDISDSMYIEDSQGRKRSSISSGTTKSELIVEKKSRKTFKIRYNQIASNSTKIKKIYFNRIIKDYDMYVKNGEFNDILMITIDL